MSRPSISVAIAVYNGGTTIGRAIESTLSQTYCAHELIVVDDGSTDNTAAVVKEFGDKLRYVYQPNSGVSAARNAAARLATSEWLAFLDADDWYYPDRLRWHAEMIARVRDLDFLTGDYEYRRLDEGLIGRSMESTEAGKVMLAKANGELEVVMELDEMGPFVEDHFGDTHTLTVPRNTFLQLGGYPIGRAVCEDVNLLIRLCARSRRVGVICEPMGVYLIRPNSATRTDPLRSQQLTLEALLPLKAELGSAPQSIRRGYRGRLRRARLNLAYALLRQRRRLQAMAPVLASFREHPSYATLRDAGSVALGVFQRPK